jgi:hypothetical protein
LENPYLTTNQIRDLIQAVHTWSQIQDPEPPQGLPRPPDSLPDGRHPFENRIRRSEALFEILLGVMKRPNMDESTLRVIYSMGVEHLDKKREYQKNHRKSYEQELEWFMTLGLRGLRPGRYGT